ncbi:RDD family [Corynebacterium kutscheri]|uniref:RDD family n=1 Tax=Corynebacterium kutscheri TaxID=35755 RepID=A0A0F6QZM4_9CORY|nr:RDD family protein [Corynebacterium kutscheri]AKE41252.1 hypothetical protein UL82_05385 [Corynebacterium kutscheri]VEH08528.1 RDD family [Corynebacterium kutscheri]VEH09574.1 RDD family [Corynebacterium kutscheri]VEH79657.1 RDD family [Corynebacterium kutscheri]
MHLNGTIIIRRVVAAICDFLIIGGLLLAMPAIAAEVFSPTLQGAVLVAVLSVLALYGYKVICEWIFGITLGKKLLGLEIHYRYERWWSSLVRNTWLILALVLYFLFSRGDGAIFFVLGTVIVVFITALAHASQRHVFDLLAGTQVTVIKS